MTDINTSSLRAAQSAARLLESTTELLRFIAEIRKPKPAQCRTYQPATPVAAATAVDKPPRGILPDGDV